MAELAVAADLVKQGFRVAFPFGEDCDWDLLFWRPPSQELERVQVKYTESNGCVAEVRCLSQSLTNGRVRAVKRYSAAMIEWLAVYDGSTSSVFYIPSDELGDGRSRIHLRLVAPRNNQRLGIRMADDYRVPTIRGEGP